MGARASQHASQQRRIRCWDRSWDAILDTRHREPRSPYGATDTRGAPVGIRTPSLLIRRFRLDSRADWCCLVPGRSLPNPLTSGALLIGRRCWPWSLTAADRLSRSSVGARDSSLRCGICTDHSRPASNGPDGSFDRETVAVREPIASIRASLLTSPMSWARWVHPDGAWRLRTTDWTTSTRAAEGERPAWTTPPRLHRQSS